MKEATGELNMTVITVVAIAAVGAFFYAFVWPNIQRSIGMNTCKNVCPGGEAETYTVSTKTCKCTNGDEISVGDDSVEIPAGTE